ncbi:DUF732 domain-containing protein [Corynebacterium sp. A21]|uniref:DUF732 domain-containing protein n=1 Tax=Corynebacterium sp. A21 TaxID=3457318 RepID=UPI003FD2335F
MRNSRKYASLLITCVAALGLAACGGDATVENDPATELSSVAPLTRESGTSSASSASTSASEASGSTSAPGTNAPVRPEPLPQDGAAEEIEEIPEQTIERSPEEEAFLGEVAEGEIDITGVEEQLIGAAATVCESVESGNENVIVPAVAGQLVEQGKTQLPAEEAATLIESAAESAYC